MRPNMRIGGRSNWSLSIQTKWSDQNSYDRENAMYEGTGTFQITIPYVKSVNKAPDIATFESAFWCPSLLATEK